MASDLKFTGERFHPDKSGEMWFEHWHRYHYVLPLVARKRVLDIACGEGYGSALMANLAADVTGVDISTAAIKHALDTYASVSNVQFREGQCTAIPLPDGSVDVVISFETLEHIHEHDAFLAEVKRVLVPGGLFIVSTPNKAEYTDARGYQNEFHLRELYAPEFDVLLNRHFQHRALRGQRNGFHSQIVVEGDTATRGELVRDTMPARAGQVPAPVYFIAFASDDAASLKTLPTMPNAFTAFEDNQVDVFMQIWRHSQHLEARVAALETEKRALVEKLAVAQPRPNNIQHAGTPTTEGSAIERLIKRLSR
jgi:SAM-dependent methyltransferase